MTGPQDNIAARRGGALRGALGLLLCAGCAAPVRRAAPAPGAAAQWHTVFLGAQARRYLLVVPQPSRAPRPLMLMLHGHGDDVQRLRRRSGLDAAAEAHDFLVAYPLGTGWGGLPPRGWNAGSCCGYARQRNIDDVAFLRAVVDDIGTRYPIDRARVYAAGVSNGAMMAQRLACEAAGTFTAVASVAGTLGVAHCQPRAPVSVLEIHGTADRLVPYEGGVPTRPGAPPRVDWPVAAVMRGWAARAGCQAHQAERSTPSVRAITYGACADGVQMRLYTLEGGRHAWPATADFSATQEILKFFNLDPGPTS